MKLRIRNRNEKVCGFCEKAFIASRSDTVYCSIKCKRSSFNENRRFEIPQVPQSGIKGISYDRFRKKWSLRIPVGDERRNCGYFETIEKAKAFREEILNDNGIR